MDKKTKPRKKVVKGWACIEIRKGYGYGLEYDWTDEGRSVYAIYKDKGEAQNYANFLNEDGIPICGVKYCSITYSVPITPHRKG